MALNGHRGAVVRRQQVALEIDVTRCIIPRQNCPYAPFSLQGYVWLGFWNHHFFSAVTESSPKSINRKMAPQFDAISLLIFQERKFNAEHLQVDSCSDVNYHSL